MRAESATPACCTVGSSSNRSALTCNGQKRTTCLCSHLVILSSKYLYDVVSHELMATDLEAGGKTGTVGEWRSVLGLGEIMLFEDLKTCAYNFQQSSIPDSVW